MSPANSFPLARGHCLANERLHVVTIGFRERGWPVRFVRIHLIQTLLNRRIASRESSDQGHPATGKCLRPCACWVLTTGDRAFHLFDQRDRKSTRLNSSH